MTDYANQEFQRILNNPQNEIISDSLKSRLGSSSSMIDLTVSFGEKQFECTLDSFSVISGSKKLSRISLLLGPEIVHMLLAGGNFVINCSEPDIYITSDSFETIDCFKYNNNAYVLELSSPREGVLND